MDIEVANKFSLLLSSVILDKAYWKTAHLMLWGPSIKLANTLHKKEFSDFEDTINDGM